MQGTKQNVRMRFVNKHSFNRHDARVYNSTWNHDLQVVYIQGMHLHNFECVAGNEVMATITRTSR